VDYSTGLSFQYNFTQTLSLRTGLAYERKGAVDRNVTFTDNNAIKLFSTDIHTYYDYMILPFLVRASFGKRTAFFVNAGTYAGYLLQATYVYKDPREGKTKFDFTNQTKKFDWGLSAGLGVSIPIKEKLMLPLRYVTTWDYITFLPLPFMTAELSKLFQAIC